MSLIIPSAPQFSLYESNIGATPSNVVLGTQVTNPVGAANTKDTVWTELIASSAFDAQLLVVCLFNSFSTGVNTSTLIDIGIGASTAETVLIPDLLAGSINTGNSAPHQHIFPLYVPAGSRISARSQSIRTAGSTYVLVQLFGGPKDPDRWWCGQQVTAYGINTADSGGVAVTAGNSGAETTTPVAIGTTTSDHEVIVFAAQIAASGSNNLQYHYDVGIDTASTAWLARDTFIFATDTAEALHTYGPAWQPIYARVPSGSVLVSGGECSGTAQAVIDIGLYGVS